MLHPNPSPNLGQNRAEMLQLLEFLIPHLPADKPNHLLGIADPESNPTLALALALTLSLSPTPTQPQP